MPVTISLNHWTIVSPTFSQLLNFVLSASLAVFSTIQVLKSKSDFHLLRWQSALWISSLLVMFSSSFAAKNPENVTFGWIIASPLLLIAAYSYFQSRKPNGGNQLDIPVDIIHGFKRIGWRWVTPPKYDFWLCWIGLLFPAALGVTQIAYNWNYPSNSWLIFVKILGFGYLLWFAFRWVIAPINKAKFRELVVATAGLRVVGFVYYFSLGVPADGLAIARLAGGCVVASMWTGFFESAFSRSSERALPQGIQEYEAIEGPSLGL